MLQLHPTNRNAWYCCTGSAGMSVQVTSGQCACLFYFLLSRHQCNRVSRQNYACFYVALDQHTCQKPSIYVCNSFTRQAGIMKYLCFKRCFEPTGMFVAVAPGHLSHFVTIKLDQHACLLELHIPVAVFESVATD